MQDAFPAVRLGAIDATMRANDETVQVVDQARIARFRARDGEVRGRATINAAEFAHFLASQTFQRRCVEQLEQVFESLPGVFALSDEAIDRHRKKIQYLSTDYTELFLITYETGLSRGMRAQLQRRAKAGNDSLDRRSHC